MSSFGPPFPIEEYRDRLSKVREEMARREVDLFLVHTPENILYLTGYQTTGYFSYQCLLVSALEDPAILTRRLEAENAQLLSWVQNRFVYHDTENRIEKTAEMMRQFPRSEKIGVEKNSWFLTVAMYEALASLVGWDKLVDCSQLVDQIRLVKSPREIAYMRDAARIVDIAMAAGVGAIREGASENDIAAAVSHAAIIAGSEYTGMPHLIKSGERCNLAHASWDNRRLERGDAVFMEVSGCVKRYSAVMMRTAQVSVAAPEVSRAADAVIESLERTIRMIRPGVRTGDLYEVARSTIERAGFLASPRRMGYSLGLGFPPRTGEWDALDFQPGGRTEILPGMIFHVIPAVVLPRAYVGITETVLVTERGHDVLTSYPRTMRII